VANSASDQGLVDTLLEHDPWMVGFSCYLWNVDRTLWLARRLKDARPDVLIVVGGPEITADNDWVLASPWIDFAIVGEGEQTFAELLQVLRDTAPGSPMADRLVPGLWCARNPRVPLFRKPMANLNEVSSPYLEGILDAADERMLFLETVRGCVFKCKFCYYPKSYDQLYFVDREKIVANLRHARSRGAREVVLLDPTLNQRKDFDDFLRLLARENPEHQFKYFGELRAEGIKPPTAALLRQANFTEVEIGLQSIDPTTQSLMDRRNNLKAFEKGVEALLEAGLEVKVDLIIGLPGDTQASIRRGFEYLSASGLFTSVQVFNLAILPGTAFRHEAASLGLKYQSRPPYYVLETPTLDTSQFYGLMAEAQAIFDTEWDPFPAPKLVFQPHPSRHECLSFDLDDSHDLIEKLKQVPAGHRCQALTVWFRGTRFRSRQRCMLAVLESILQSAPHSTLQIVLEPTQEATCVPAALPQQLLEVCYREPNYLDRYYSLNPHGNLGSKRVLILVPSRLRQYLSEEWLDEIGQSCTVVYQGAAIDEDELRYYELSLA
jgi:radical SAM superfamily enzyme YgiQ (UPF0313 family)